MSASSETFPPAQAGFSAYPAAGRVLVRALARGALAHAYLLVGPPGPARGAFLRTLGLGALCPDGLDEGHRPSACPACRACADGSHPDLLVVEGDGRSLGIERVRQLAQALRFRPAWAARRVALMDDADGLTPDAASAMLKLLEEPPGFAVLALGASGTDRLLPTIVSRCQVLPLRPGPAAAARSALEAGGVPPEDAGAATYLALNEVEQARAVAGALAQDAARAALDGASRALVAASAYGVLDAASALAALDRGALLVVLDRLALECRDRAAGHSPGNGGAATRGWAAAGRVILQARAALRAPLNARLACEAMLLLARRARLEAGPPRVA